METVVRCTEIDVNGHLNNAKFVEYLEWGREEWYECHGFGYDRLEELGAITVVVNINLNYRQPCHQGDRLRIVTSPQQRGHTSFALAQRIERSDGTVVADGVVTLVTVDSAHAAPYRCQGSSPGSSRPATDPAFFDRRSHPDHRCSSRHRTSSYQPQPPRQARGLAAETPTDSAFCSASAP